jgi:hypothetical protein
MTSISKHGDSPEPLCALDASIGGWGAGCEVFLVSGVRLGGGVGWKAAVQLSAGTLG